MTKRIDIVYTHIVDVLYQFGGLAFTWDIHKAASNFAKHRVRFEQVCELFLDPLLRFADASAGDEAREGLLDKLRQ